MVSRSPSLVELVRSDLAAWATIWCSGPNAAMTWSRVLHMLFSFAGLRATILYRVSHALQRRGVRMVPQVLGQLNLMLHGFDIPASVEIGPGLYVPHPVGTVVMATRVGSGVTLVSGVTIGMRNTPVFPVIGDNVYIGAGARVLGDITVGNDVSIGANAVVLHSVPDHSVAVGVPAVARPAHKEPSAPDESTASASALVA